MVQHIYNPGEPPFEGRASCSFIGGNRISIQWPQTFGVPYLFGGEWDLSVDGDYLTMTGERAKFVWKPAQ